jgi:catechol 2,3-dioxygenase-like lactoylglutathione lyase family enzyme
MSNPIVSGGGTGESDNEPWFYFVRYGASTRAYPANWKGTVFLVGSILTVVVCAVSASLLWQFTGQVAWFVGFFATIFPAFFIALFAVIRVKGQEVGGVAGYGGVAGARSLAALQRRAQPNTLVQAVDHVQLAIPPGGEDQARPFYKDLLGLAEQPKPPELAARGGAWFDNGVVKVHLGVEDPFNPAEKAHPAFRVNDVSGLAAQARAAGYRVKDDEALPGYQRIYIYDPFGNRLEFLKPN